MKILLLTSSFPDQNSVAGIFLPDLITELKHLGASVHVLTQNPDANKMKFTSLGKDCELIHFPWGGGGKPLIKMMERPFTNFPLIIQFFVNGARTGIKIAKKWNPDFIFAEWIVPSGLIAFIISKRLNIPYAVRALGSDVLIGAKKRFVKILIEMIARNSLALFADGFLLCEMTSDLAGGKKCYFAPTSRNIELSRSGFQSENNGKRFKTCTIGRLHPVKGHKYLVEAVAELRKMGVDIHSYLVGSGEEEGHLASLIAKLDLKEVVELTGQLPDEDVARILSECDCVVIPSLSESIPVVFSEALAAGKPLVVSDAGDMKFLVEKYDLGYVVPKGDSVALAHAIFKLRNNPQPSHFVVHHSEVLDILSVQAAAKTILDVCRERLSS